MTSDPQLKNYLTDVVSQLKGLWTICSRLFLLFLQH